MRNERGREGKIFKEKTPTAHAFIAEESLNMNSQVAILNLNSQVASTSVIFNSSLTKLNKFPNYNRFALKR